MLRLARLSVPNWTPGKFGCRNLVTIVWQYQRAVTFNLGVAKGFDKGPGLRLDIPVFQKVIKVDMRTTIRELPQQEVITRDNISVKVDAVLYSRVTDARRAVCRVEDYDKALCSLAKAKLRAVLSECEMNEILHRRDMLNDRILESIRGVVEDWGVEVQAVLVQDIRFDETMTRAMAKKAEAERTAQATIIHANAQVATAATLLEAAAIMEKSPVALRLRELDVLAQMAKEPSHSTVIIPTGILDAVRDLRKGGGI